MASTEHELSSDSLSGRLGPPADDLAKLIKSRRASNHGGHAIHDHITSDNQGATLNVCQITSYVMNYIVLIILTIESSAKLFHIPTS